METVTGPNGEVTTRTALAANSLFGITDTKVAEKVVDGVYALRGWRIANSYAKFLGTPTAKALAAASVDENLQFVRYLVDPRKAEGLRQTLTLAVEGDPRIRRLELRNGVLVIGDAAAPAPTHLRLTRQELAAFVLGACSARARRRPRMR